MLATTCSLFAVAAVTFNISPVCTTRGAVNSSTVLFALTALVLKRLNVAGDDSASVIVNVIVSALPESSDTRIDFTMPVVNSGAVYSVVALVVVRSFFAFVYTLAIILKTTLPLRVDLMNLHFLRPCPVD